MRSPTGEQKRLGESEADRPASQPNAVQSGFFARSSALVLTAFVLVTPLLVYWAGRAVGTNSNRLSDWLPTNLEETVSLGKFNQWFGDGQFVVVSWDGCSIDTSAEPADASRDDPRLERLARMLAPPSVKAATESEKQHSFEESSEMVLNAPSNFEASVPEYASIPLTSTRSESERRHYFRKVITSRSLLQTLTEAPLGIDSDQAVQRLTGTVLGPEGQACLIVFLNDLPTEELREAIGFRHLR